MIFLELLKFKQIGFLIPAIQIFLICTLVTITFITQRREYKITGKTYGRYPWGISTFLSSIYEEFIFRGFVLFGSMMFLSPILAVIISSVLFGLWHIKNYKWQTKKQTIYQILYAGIVFGPIACIITLWSGTIWLTVIVHYLHNLIVSSFKKR